jgi:ElaB/YqjD/DUF883 family membrane-anchored ribosome-binding protein
MTEHSHFISKEDREKLLETLDEIEEILKDEPSDRMARLKKIREELAQIRTRIMSRLAETAERNEMNMQKPEVTRAGVLDMQVCVPEDWTDIQVEDFANKENYCGTKNGWKIRKDSDLLDGMPERNPCSERNECVHITLDA